MGPSVMVKTGGTCFMYAFHRLNAYSDLWGQKRNMFDRLVSWQHAVKLTCHCWSQWQQTCPYLLKIDVSSYSLSRKDSMELKHSRGRPCPLLDKAYWWIKGSDFCNQLEEKRSHKHENLKRLLRLVFPASYCLLKLTSFECVYQYDQTE